MHTLKPSRPMPRIETMAPRACPCQLANCTLIARRGLRAVPDRKAQPMLRGVSCGYIVERVTGIEPPLSAWEVSVTVDRLPAELLTWEPPAALSASDRDYPRLLVRSG